MASKPCLPVSRRRKTRDNETISFENIETMDATEYLSMVVQQSNKMPDILMSEGYENKPESAPQKSPSKKIRDHIPIEGSAASLSYLVSNRTAILTPPSANLVPANCREWVDQTLANFSQLRLYLEKLHNQNGKAERKQAVPSMSDRPGWHIFCLGIKEARGNMGSYFGSDDGEDEEMKDAKDEEETKPHQGDKKSDSNGNTDLWRNGLPEEGYAPTTSLIQQLDQVMVRRVIAHLVHYVEEGWYPCSGQRSQWLYSLLARLEKPVHRDDAAVLFGLLKVLTKARATWKNDRKGLARLNVLITIVGIYFEQGGGYVGVMEA